MRTIRRVLAHAQLLMAPLIAASALASCSSPPRPAPRSGARALSECHHDASLRRSVQFARSPGGVPEVGPAWVRAHRCDVRVVDVRDPDERAGALGVLGFAEPVPLDRLAEEASAWSPDEPLVLVCRSGRRSARAVRVLEDLGFVRAASMTGGMLAWHDRGYPVEHPATALDVRSASDVAAPLGPDAVAAHVGDPRRIRWVKAAALLMQARQSCVDGRDTDAVIGTPGGDAGELLLALAAAERVRGERYADEEVGPLLDAYLDAFGRFYVHSDREALHRLGEHLRADSRFAPLLAAGDPDAVERLVRRPPRALEGPLLERLDDPEHVGCGHLRSTLLHPEEYGARRELTEALLRAVFVRLWRGDAIDFVVLEGEHREVAVLNVTLDRAVGAFTRIPTVAPRIADHELFVNHPEVSGWVREQNAHFLIELDPRLRELPEREPSFLRALRAMGEGQLAATLAHLAPDAPIYEVHVSEASVRVEGPRRADRESSSRVSPR